MMFGYGSHWAFWQVSIMWVGMLAFWALIIWAVFTLVRSTTQGPSLGPTNEPPGGTAKSILDERLAKGELDIEEYRLRRDAIRGTDQTMPAGSAQ
jgi:putative membrane protein